MEQRKALSGGGESLFFMQTKRAHQDMTRYSMGIAERGTWSNNLDIARRFGTDGEHGLRVNVSYTTGATGIRDEYVRNKTFAVNYDHHSASSSTNLFFDFRDTWTEESQRYFYLGSAAITAIGAIESVAGVDYYIYQDQEGFNHRFTEDMLVGKGKGEVNYEKVIALHPDVFITTNNSTWATTAEKLKAFDIPVVVVGENIRTIYGVETEITERDGHLHVRLKKDLP